MNLIHSSGSKMRRTTRGLNSCSFSSYYANDDIQCTEMILDVDSGHARFSSFFELFSVHALRLYRSETASLPSSFRFL